MIISESGITFYAEYNHICNAQSTIDASLFSTYSLSGGDMSQSEELRLGIDAQLVSDSLASAASTIIIRPKNGASGAAVAASDSVVCYIKYYGEGYPLIIEFDDRLMSELIEFSTFYYELLYPYDTDPGEKASELLVDHEQIELEVILKSDLLANLLLDLQQLDTEELHLYASSSTLHGSSDDPKNQLYFISKGSIGYLKLIFPSGKTMLEKMELSKISNESRTEASVLSSFNFLLFLRIVKAVKLSTRCKMLKDRSGVFSVQFLCKVGSIARYPGTLITFNMLERSTAEENYGRLGDVDINTLFDDELYQHVKEYGHELNASKVPDAQRRDVHNSEPFTYASFKMTDHTLHSGEDGQTAKRRKENGYGNDDEREDGDGHDFTTVEGAVDVPLFL